MADSDAKYVTVELATSELGITDATALSLLEGWIERASRAIDLANGRRFYAPTTAEVRYLDTPSSGDTLYLDHDLVGVTSIVNGDGTTISGSAYRLLPLNGTPKYAVQLKAGSSGVSWKTDANGEATGAIVITGKWGYSETPPLVVKQLCLEMVKHWYGVRKQTRGVVSKQDGDVRIQYSEASDTLPLDLARRLRVLPFRPYVF